MRSIAFADFLIGLGILFVLEGLMFAASPSWMRKAMKSAIATPDNILRAVGIGSAVAGLILIWVTWFGVVSAFIAFETAVGRCEGHLRIRRDDDGTDGDVAVGDRRCRHPPRRRGCWQCVGPVACTYTASVCHG